ncbi:MAG: Esterase YbfF [Gammaproteobacteria bacterium]|nr:Esterase YbfF [Gammaproteobacteria bacterium]
MSSESTLSLACRDIGQGPAVIILHGLFGSSRNWQIIARRLADRCRVVSVDLRNHGDSPHAAAMGYRAMAADVHALADRLALPQPVLIGHSMGGKVAMTAALMQPARWRMLAVVDIAPVEYPIRYAELVDAMQAVAASAPSTRAQADEMLRGAEPDPAVRNFLLQNLVARDGRYAWRINLPAIRQALPEIAGFPDIDGRFDGPVLFARGERSRAIGPEHEPVIRARFPRARIVTIAGAGHWPHADSPDAFLDTLAPWLAR